MGCSVFGGQHLIWTDINFLLFKIGYAITNFMVKISKFAKILKVATSSCQLLVSLKDYVSYSVKPSFDLPSQPTY